MATIGSVETIPPKAGARAAVGGATAREEQPVTTEAPESTDAVVTKASAETQVKAEDASVLAARLQETINAAFGKELRFNVATETTPNKGVNFQIVDAKTGEVVRQFPAEEVRRIAESGHGVLIDAPA